MSRTNASGWMALAVVGAVVAAAVLIREAPGVRPAGVRPVLAARTLPLVAAPLAATAEPVRATSPVAEGVAPARARRTAPARLMADARNELPLGPSPSSTARIATPRALSASSGDDTVVAAAQAPGATDTPLAARRLEVLAPGATTAAPDADSGSSRDDAGGAVKRAFDTAGRSIAGGMKTASAAIKGVF